MNLVYCIFLNFDYIQIKSCRERNILNDKCKTQEIVENRMVSLKRKT